MTARKIARRAGTKRLHNYHPLTGKWKGPEKQFRIPVRYDHPLIGTWREVENPVDVTSVVYEVTVKDGRFVVTGLDEENGTQLRILQVRWDGEFLKFNSVYPTTDYQTKHAMTIVKRGLVKHFVTFTELEFWRKRR